MRYRGNDLTPETQKGLEEFERQSRFRSFLGSVAAAGIIYAPAIYYGGNRDTYVVAAFAIPFSVFACVKGLKAAMGDRYLNRVFNLNQLPMTTTSSQLTTESLQQALLDHPQPEVEVALK